MDEEDGTTSHLLWPLPKVYFLFIKKKLLFGKGVAGCGGKVATGEDIAEASTGVGMVKTRRQ